MIPRPGPAPRALLRRADGAVDRSPGPEAVARLVRQGGGVLWMDVDANDPAQHAWLERVFHFHPLAIEDTLNPNSRIKIEEYPGYLFAIIRGVRFDDTTADPYDLETFNLCFFLGRDYLVTVHRAASTVCGDVFARVSENPDLLDRGSARTMHTVIDESIDAYFPLIERLDDFVDRLEERVFVQCDEHAVRDIFTVRRLVLALRRHLQPQRDVMHTLANRPSALLPVETQFYFRDVLDHVLRITDTLESYRELLTGTMEGALSQTSNRLATVTKTLSVLATLSIPFVMVSGMWGMNFVRIPLQNAPYGFEVLLFLQVALAIVMVALLRWRRLL
ncbi:MAG TPA: magnesium transporter CorA family protein [Gemmatimonadaceae bacterium]|nr:magnesium transporter CorA family protein [Gemmatimonadaceae bacterium]